MPVIFPKENNPHWPLPADYLTLSEEGKRLARVNACSLRGTPELEVAAAKFYREYYLFTMAPGTFYKHGIVASPPAHYRLFAEMAAYNRLQFIAPRSFAKSTLIREKISRNMLTRPNWENLQVLVRWEKVYDDFDIYMRLFKYNERIVNDFGNLVPRRGDGIWNKSHLKLTNGAGVKGAVVKAVTGGPRPHAIFIDDVERDDSMLISPTDLKENMANMIFNAIIPMTEDGVPVLIIGSYPRPNSFMDWMSTTDDPRIEQKWRRVILSIDDDGQGGLLWKDKWDKERIQDLIEEVGEEVFDVQYRSRPGMSVERIFKINPDLHTYWIKGPDPATEPNPLESKSILVACRPMDVTQQPPTFERHEMPFGETVQKMYRFITVDYANTNKMSSDLTAIHVIGASKTRDFPDVFWSLDLDLGRWRRPEIVQHIMKMAMKWGVSLIGIEAYPLQLDIYQEIIEGLYSESFNHKWRIKPYPIKFPTSYTKADKIRGIEPRFNAYKFKMPIHRARIDKSPHYELWKQFEFFTDKMTLLKNDDAIDTVAMAQAVLRTRNVSAIGGDQAPSVSQMIKSGRLMDDHGIPLLSGTNATEWSEDLIYKLVHRQYEEAERSGNFRYLPSTEM